MTLVLIERLSKGPLQGEDSTFKGALFAPGNQSELFESDDPAALNYVGQLLSFRQ